MTKQTREAVAKHVHSTSNNITMYKNNVYGLGRVISILLLFYCLAYPLHHVRHTETHRERDENWLKKRPKEERPRQGKIDRRRDRENREGCKKLIWGAAAAQARGARLCELGPLVNLPRCARSMCRASSSADAWYVANVSIIFWCSMLVLHQLLYVLSTLCGTFMIYLD
jgi:hypothetical protein